MGRKDRSVTTLFKVFIVLAVLIHFPIKAMGRIVQSILLRIESPVICTDYLLSVKQESFGYPGPTPAFRIMNCYELMRLVLNRFGSRAYFVILYWIIRFVVPRNFAALLWLPRASFRASMIRERS
jgi:hypothetical protein